MNDKKKFCLTALLLFSAVCASAISAIFITEIEAAQEKKQIIINPDNIKKLEAFGETDNPFYIEFYPPTYLFDNLVNSHSFWTQQGNSGSNLELNQKLADKKVCSIEIGVFQPSNTPFTLLINEDDEKVFSGNLDNEKVSVNLGSGSECITDLEKIEMNFNPADRKVWTTLSEIKLFSEVIDEPIPPVEGNVTKFIINNSKITMDLNDSEVIINTSGDSKAKIVEQKEKEKEDSD